MQMQFGESYERSGNGFNGSNRYISSASPGAENGVDMDQMHGIQEHRHSSSGVDPFQPRPSPPRLNDRERSYGGHQPHCPAIGQARRRCLFWQFATLPAVVQSQCPLRGRRSWMHGSGSVRVLCLEEESKVSPCKSESVPARLHVPLDLQHVRYLIGSPGRH
jgi:hypothetical protein